MVDSPLAAAKADAILADIVRFVYVSTSVIMCPGHGQERKQRLFPTTWTSATAWAGVALLCDYCAWC